MVSASEPRQVLGCIVKEATRAREQTCGSGGNGHSDGSQSPSLYTGLKPCHNDGPRQVHDCPSLSLHMFPIFGMSLTGALHRVNSPEGT